MGRTIVRGLAAAAALALITASANTASAQVGFNVGGGVTIPLADWSDEEIGGAGTGFHGLVGVGFQPATLPVGIRVDGMFHRNAVEIDGVDLDANYQIISGTANGVYMFQTAETSTFHPYIIGGVGVYNVDATGDDAEGFESAMKFGVNAGAGFNFAAGESINLFVEGRFHNVFGGLDEENFLDEGSLNMVPVTVGLRFGGS